MGLLKPSSDKLEFYYLLKSSYHSIRSRELLDHCNSVRVQHLESKVWADYAFLSACHSAVIDDTQNRDLLIRAIKSAFPEYSPYPRLTWSALFMPQEELADNTLCQRMELLGLFIEQNPSFSFVNHFGNYFFNMEKLGLKSDLSTLI